MCGRVLQGHYFEVNGEMVCEGCRYAVETAFQQRGGPGGFVKAACAALAAVAGSSLYYLVREVTGLEIGLISILVGWGVGKSVRWGSKAKGGWAYQSLAIFLTYMAIVSTYLPAIVHQLSERQARGKAAATAPAQAAGGVAAAPANPAQTPAQKPPRRHVGFGEAMLGLGAILLLAAAIPFLGGSEEPDRSAHHRVRPLGGLETQPAGGPGDLRPLPVGTVRAAPPPAHELSPMRHRGAGHPAELPGLSHAGPRQDLKALASAAETAAARGDVSAEIAAWRQALPLLPAGSRQLQQIQGKSPISPAVWIQLPPPVAFRGEPALEGGGVLTTLGLLAWKLKALLLVAATKGKLLLLGLTNAGTLLSMALSFGVYWAAFGWPFAAGLILSLYVHEMGHVAALRRLGIPFSLPMFLPGVGAVVRLRQPPASPSEDARIGLAGPLWEWAPRSPPGSSLWAAAGRSPPPSRDGGRG